VALFPTPAEIAAQTPANRDRAIDVIRIVSLVAVVFGHTIMAVSTVRDGVFVWGNLLEWLPAFGALTWLLQIMPLFFFAGTAASVESWSGGRSWGGWLMQRCIRLYRPVFFYLAFWGVALAVLRFVLPKHVYEPVAGTSIQLLWFLGAYVLVLATIPLLHRITGTARLAARVVAVCGFDRRDRHRAAQRHRTVRTRLPQHRRLADPRHVRCRVPARSAVPTRGDRGRGIGVRRQRAAGVARAVRAQPGRLPGTAAAEHDAAVGAAGHAIMMCALAIAVAPAISRWAQRPRVWWLVAIGNSGAMTLYLWHMPALLSMHLVFDALGLPRYDMHAPGFIALSVVQVVSMTAMVGVLFVALRPLENNPLPGWDGGFVAAPGVRSAAVGTLLCTAGAATLVSVRWGLKDDGLICIAVLLIALIAARAPAADSNVSVTAAVTR
jgi:Acyltransferase family